MALVSCVHVVSVLGLVLFLCLHLLLVEFKRSRFLASGSLRGFLSSAHGASISSAGTSSVVRLRSQQPVRKSPDCQHKRSQHRKEDVVKEGMF